MEIPTTCEENAILQTKLLIAICVFLGIDVEVL